MVLIDKETAYKELSEYYHHTEFIQHLALSEALDRVPVVDAIPVRHARLINAHPYGECSCCGELIDSRDRFRYCPYCGARLVGEGEKWLD